MKFKSSLFLFLIFKSPTVLTADMAKIDEFSRRNQSHIDSIMIKKEVLTENKYTLSEIEALKVQLEDITNSPLKTYLIPKNTVIINLENNMREYVSKDLVVKAHTKQNFDRERFIVDKDNLIRYKTSAKNMTIIDKVTKLYRNPKHFIAQKPKVVQKLHNENFNFSTAYSFQMGLFQPTFIKSILEDATASRLIRTEVEINYNSKKIFHPGFTLSYETATGSLSSSDKYQFKSIAFGPNIKFYHFYEDFSFTISSKLSVFSTLEESRSDYTESYNLSQTSLNLSLTKTHRTKSLGTFEYGGAYQRTWSKAKSNDLALNIAESSANDDSITFKVTHRSQWIW